MTLPAILTFGFAAAMFAGAALAETSPALDASARQAEEGAFMSQVIYHCERGVRVPVAYITTPDGHGFAIAQIDGHQVAMLQVPSGSGARYFSADETRPYGLHGKGDEAMFFHGLGSDPANLLTDCKTE